MEEALQVREQTPKQPVESTTMKQVFLCSLGKGPTGADTTLQPMEDSTAE